jgi:hypothetical protein
MNTSTTFSRLTLTAFTLWALTLAGQAQAQTTIDQNKALSGSITPGDSPGFPITLSVAGAYKLTGNLVVPANLSGVEVTAAGVTLDLNGFNISGPILCVRTAITAVVSCTASNTATKGIEFKAGGSNLRNGQVRGFAFGVTLSGADQVDNVLVEHNANTGVVASSSSGARTLLRNVRSQLNGSHGFSLSDTMVQACTAASNGQDGFIGVNLFALDSAAHHNLRFGFNNFTGGTGALTLGRSVAQFNHLANMFKVLSLGGSYDDVSVF